MATAPITVINPQLGESQRLFSEQARAKHEELIESGQSRPFTVINFNPVPLVLEGELNRYRVPSPDDERLPKDVARIALPYDGKEWIGHALTLRDPHIYGRTVNATAFQGDRASAIPERQVMYYLPIAVAYTFLEHFSPIFVTRDDKKAAPPPKDARNIFGVLAFEGDLNTLQHEVRKMKREMELEAAGRTPSEEERAKVLVPLARVSQIGKVTSRSYHTVSFPLREYLTRMFAGQLRFADVTIAKAQQKWSETSTIKEISESDRIWRRWAIRMGYAKQPKAGEKDWLNELIELTRDVDGIPLAAQLRKCQACRTPEPEADTPFCPKCGAPINTFTTFMAGFPVPDAWLMALQGEEREIALTEIQRRREGFGGETKAAAGQSTAPAAKTVRGPGGKFLKADAAADDTQLPGDDPAGQ